jgi:hypothetical protein
MGGFQSLVHDAGQVGLGPVQVHRVLQARRERGDGPVGVIPRRLNQDAGVTRFLN